MNDDSTKFVCWIRHHGRTEDICTVLDWSPEYLYPVRTGRLSRERRYLTSIKQTRAIYKAAQGQATATMLPPPFMPLINRIGKSSRHIYDIHSGMFTDARWRIFLKPALMAFRDDDILLAHNPHDEAALKAATKSHVVLFQDPALTADLMRTGQFPRSTASTLLEAEDRPHRPTFIFPSSGDTDEPLREFSAAVDGYFDNARRSTMVVTGNAAPNAISSKLISTPGFLPRTQFDKELQTADVVVSLSTRPDILQRAAFEAVVAGKRPLVRESTALRTILGDFAVYATGCTPSEIGAALDLAWSRRNVTSSELQQTRNRIIGQEAEQISTLKELL